MRVTLVLLFSLCSFTTALANPPIPGSDDDLIMQGYSAWISQQSNAKGQLCCSIADARPVEVRQVNNHWEVKFLHPTELPYPYPVGWKEVPERSIIRDETGQPISSPMGLSVAWWYGGEVRCFTIPQVM